MTIPKLKAIILDDEALNIDALDRIIMAYCPGVIVVARCQNPLEAIGLVHDLRPDILFLDIAMPELNGFEFLNKFETLNFKTIFTTAYTEYAIKAIKYAAFDFLLKPIDKEELILAINRAQANVLLPSSTEINQHKGTRTNLALPTNEGFSFIDIGEIVFCQSDNSYTIYKLIDGKKIVVSRGLKETSEMLEKHDFFRIHQSYLINGKYIRKYNKSNSSVVMSNGEELPISLRRKDEFLMFIDKM